MGQSAVIGSLRVVLGLDSATFDAGLEQASLKAQAQAGNIGKALDSVFDSSRLRLFEEGGARLNVFGSALEHLGAVGIATGVAMGAMAIGFEEVKKSLEFADKIEDAAKAASVSTTVLQEYRFAVHDLGGSYTDADRAITDFTVKFRLAAAEYSKKTTRPFEALGLDAKSLGDTEHGLRATIDAIHNLKDAGDQAAAAEKVGLTPMLAAIRAGGPAIDALRQAAHDLGYVMDEALISKAAEANKKFEDLSAVIGVQFRSAFVDAAPAVLNLTQHVADLVTWLGKLFSMGSYSSGLQNAMHGVGQIAADLAGGHPIQAMLDANRAGRVGNDAAANGGYVKNLYGPVAGVPAPETVAGGGTGVLHPPANGNANAVRNASAAAIDAAMKEELAAQTALTGDIAKLAALRLAEVDQEIKAKNDKLAREASEGKITRAAVDQATLLNNKTADEKKAKIVQDAQFAADNQALAHSETINGYYNQIDQIQASMAATVDQRNKLETDALTNQQKIETRKLQTELDQQVARGEITDSYRKEALASLADLQAAQQAQLAENQRVAVIQEAAAHEQAGLQLQAELLSSQADLSKSTYARNVAAQKILEIEQKIETSKAQEAVDVAKVGSLERQEALARLAALPALQKAQTDQLASQTRLIDAVDEAGKSASDLASAFSSHDWARIFDDFQKTIQTVEAAFQNQGALGGSFAAANAIGSVIGGNTGKTIGDAAGAGSIALQLTGNPVIAVAAAATAALIDVLKGKPSNNGAISTLSSTGFTLSGDKRNDATSSLATAASNAILQGEQQLAAAGITLTATVKSIDIGTRDATHILLSNGQTLSSAVGNAAAAAETGLKALLSSATYASDAQKQLVDAMLAAGKGFDDITAALGAFAAAQELGGSVASQIQKLVDPEGYDISQLRAAQAARAKSVQDAADAGYLTADQLSAINDQLARLDKIELDQVVQKYADAMTQAAQQAADAATKAAQAVTTTARQELSAAVQADAASLQQAAQQFGALATSLGGYLASLNAGGQVGGASYSSLSASFTSTAALAKLGDLTAAGNLQGIGDQFLAASLAGAHSQDDYLKDLAKVKAAVQAAADTASRQASIAQQQLDALHAQTDELLNINSSVLDVATAIANLQAALAAEAAAGPAAYAAALAAATAGPTVPTDTSAITPANTNIDTSAVISPSGVTTADVAAAVADQLAPALNQIAKNTGNVADLSEIWTYGGGLPTVAV